MSGGIDDLLLGVLDSLSPPAHGLALRSARVDLPLELALRGTADAPELIAGLPRWRWRTVFDTEPSRIIVEFAGEAQR